MTHSPSPQIADVLAARLPPVFDRLCRTRYGGPVVTLHRVEDSDPSPSTVSFRLDRPELPPLKSRFAVRHLGGNMYDLTGTIEDGPSQSFIYSLPNPTPLLVPEAPHLAADVAHFLLDAMERRLGRALLRSEMAGRPPKGASSSSPPTTTPFSPEP